MEIDTNRLRGWLSAEHTRALAEVDRLEAAGSLEPIRAEFERDRLNDLATEREHLVGAVEALANGAAITKYYTEVSRAEPLQEGRATSHADVVRPVC